MGEPFDPYREALVIEQKTIWPDELAGLSREAKTRIEEALHDDASTAAELEYVRLHSGFCRSITVTQADVDRLAKS
ncbi:MAG: hypothetical protein ACYC6Y_22480 [Thermoguttaceae bacterium]